MKTCKNCVYFIPPKFKTLTSVRGFCMDFENKTFNLFAQSCGRGLPWKAYLFGTKGCKFKKR